MNFIIVPFATKQDSDFKGDLFYHACASTYVKKCARYGLIPLFVSPLMTPEQIAAIYKLAGGLLLLGGEDIKPSLYNEEPHQETKAQDTGRDELELTICKMALKEEKPILGICRGCQLLTVASGGSLIQHLPDITSINHNSESYAALVNKNAHKIAIQKNSKAHKIINKEIANVNSGHHQAAKTIGKDFIVSARSISDNIPEIIEHIKSDYFCFGVQSHPEAMEDGDLEGFFGAFAKAVATFSKREKF
ncbi:MAG TPA: gamma-glutamyl-gamma-aminobutyrate hydrolase family protein [Oligoflexia bacterium]|nr:gamma-glutamyl-gamma-aminobutyrate hydrolase family protein [Oligoflexia bacterium]HMP27357.1 gamma-glutamyl-gamma-aminobutyrate hydrolase family protein [Oligoflexia bacterium]